MKTLAVIKKTVLVLIVIAASIATVGKVEKLSYDLKTYNAVLTQSDAYTPMYLGFNW